MCEGRDHLILYTCNQQDFKKSPVADRKPGTVGGNVLPFLFFFLLFKTECYQNRTSYNSRVSQNEFLQLRDTENLSDFGDDAELTDLLDLCEDCQLLRQKQLP